MSKILTFVMCLHVSSNMAFTKRKSALFIMHSSSIGDGSEQDDIMINKVFYHCGRENSCNFVLRRRASQEFETKENERDLPNDKHEYKIWKKEKIEKRELESKTKRKEKGFKSCTEALKSGISENGIVELLWSNGSHFSAYCDMKTDGGGWTVFQRRLNDTVNFNRGWDDYVTGFGDLNNSYWLGLEAIHHLTTGKIVTVRFDLRNINSTDGYAKYKEFKVKSRGKKYEIRVGKHSGTICDGMSMSNGMPFSTFDNDNDEFDGESCARFFNGPWWYQKCSYVRLNSDFPVKGHETITEMKWACWTEADGTIVFSEIKLREDD